MKTGIELIAEERQDQLEKHGFIIKHDVKFNKHYQLVDAATELMKPLPNSYRTAPLSWSPKLWKKMLAKPYHERLAIAGALIAAEIDRIIYEFSSEA